MRRLLSSLLILVFSPGLAQELSQSNLPIFLITTNQTIVDEPKVKAHLAVINNPDGLNHVTDPVNDYDGYIGIEYRGSSSQGFPKKPYGFECWDALGNDIQATILGFPPQEDWVLIATYNDKSLMRDALAYYLGSEMMAYAPRTRFIELVINGEYQGIYMFAEKIKRDNHRVDISQLSPSDKSGDAITGGYLLKIDKFDGNSGPGFSSRFRPPQATQGQEIYFQFEYPSYDVVTELQRNYIQDFINDFETALNSPSYRDPVKGYQAFIDTESFIDYLLIQELSKNVDGYRLSTFMYKDRDSKGGKLKLGPVWDFNLAFGNADYCLGGPTDGWMLKFNEVCGGDFWLIPFWWNRLLSDPVFFYKLRSRWSELKSTTMSLENLHARIDSMASLLTANQATTRNFQRWPVLGQYVWPNVFVGNTYEQEVNYLKSWIEDRWNWLDDQLPPVSTGVEDSNHAFFVFPNPLAAGEEFHLGIPVSGQVQLQWLAMDGRVMATQSLEISPENTVVKAPESNGVFLLRVTTHQQTYYAKIVIR